MEYAVPDCPGTTVTPLRQEHGEHRLLVKVVAGGSIPLHTHTVASGMEVIYGSARPLGKVSSARAHVGDYLFKPGGMPHGFDEVGPDGFWFLSTAEGAGILRATNEWDMVMAQSYA